MDIKRYDIMVDTVTGFTGEVWERLIPFKDVILGGLDRRAKTFRINRLRQATPAEARRFKIQLVSRVAA